MRGDNGGKHLGMLFREIVTRGKQVKLAPEALVEMTGFSILGVMSHKHNYTTPVLELVCSCNTALLFVCIAMWVSDI